MLLVSRNLGRNIGCSSLTRESQDRTLFNGTVRTYTYINTYIFLSVWASIHHPKSLLVLQRIFCVLILQIQFKYVHILRFIFCCSLFSTSRCMFFILARVYSFTLNISSVVVNSIWIQYYSHELPAARCVHSIALALTASAPSSSPMRRSNSSHFLKNDLNIFGGVSIEGHCENGRNLLQVLKEKL